MIYSEKAKPSPTLAEVFDKLRKTKLKKVDWRNGKV
jgi:hypothetical protein